MCIAVTSTIQLPKGSYQKLKVQKQGGGGSDQKGRMYQPAYLVVGRVCPNHLIWSVEHIRCLVGGGGQKSL
jgi:hypothetical protein